MLACNAGGVMGEVLFQFGNTIPAKQELLGMLLQFSNVSIFLFPQVFISIARM